jgi:hypothetical protein
MKESYTEDLAMGLWALGGHDSRGVSLRLVQVNGGPGALYLDWGSGMPTASAAATNAVLSSVSRLRRLAVQDCISPRLSGRPGS